MYWLIPPICEAPLDNCEGTVESVYTPYAIWINEDVSLTVYNPSPRTTTPKPSPSFKTLGRLLLWWSKYRSTQRKPPDCSAETYNPRRCHPDKTGPL